MTVAPGPATLNCCRALPGNRCSETRDGDFAADSLIDAKAASIAAKRIAAPFGAQR